MLKKMAQELQNQARNRSSIDPSRFGDPIAVQTVWTPAGGSIGSGDKMVEVNSDRLEFRASWGAKLAFLLFLLIGLAVMIGIPFHQISSGGLSFDKNTIMPILIGLVLSSAGSYLLYFGTAPVVFDKRKGFFWKGRKAPDDISQGQALKYGVKLEDIHALQLLTELCTGSKSGTYYRYELNLVLKDATRMNALVHGDKSKLREVAGVLSTFLGKPVWDAM